MKCYVLWSSLNVFRQIFMPIFIIDIYRLLYFSKMCNQEQGFEIQDQKFELKTIFEFEVKSANIMHEVCCSDCISIAVNGNVRMIVTLFSR